MAVAYDAFSTSGTEANPNWTHTPAGTPRAVIVWVICATGVTPSSVTYGGVGMSFVGSSDHSTGETGKVLCYFLGSGIPTGAQTVAVSGTGTGGGFAVTLTAAANTEVVDSDATINSDSQANPSVTLSLGGRTSWAGISFMSGQNQPTGIAPLGSWTSRNETDNGTQTAGCYTYDTVSTADVTAGWTQTAEDAAAVAIAVSEAASQSVTGAHRASTLALNGPTVGVQVVNGAHRASTLAIFAATASLAFGLQQFAGGSATGTTITKAFSGNVQAGSLLVVKVEAYKDQTNDPFVVGDISKSAGDATLGTFTLDEQDNFNYITTFWMNAAIFSVPVTAGGSCTIQIAGMPAGAFSTIVVEEWRGLNVTASRVADTATGHATSGNSPATAAADSTAKAVFAGIMGTAAAAANTLTKGADYTEVYEEEDGSTKQTAHAEYRIVTGATTDAADWTQANNEEWQAVLVVYKEAGGAAQNVTGAHVASTLAMNAAVTRYQVVGVHRASTLQIFAPAAVAHVPAWPLKVSANGRFLEDQRGTPFFVNGTAVFELTHNLTLTEAKTVMDSLVSKGINALIVNTPSSFDESGVASDPVSNDKQGNQPFTSNDLTQPVEAFWAHVDDVLAAAKARGLVVFFWPMYLGFDDTQGFRDVLASNSLANATDYGEFIGTRYGSLGNLVWVHGGDVGPTTWAAKVQAIQDGIDATASVAQLHGTHWGRGDNPWDYTASFPEADIDIHNAYVSKPVATQVNDTYNHSPTKPTIMLEARYEGETGGTEVWMEPYRAAFSGAIGGHFSGNRPLWFCGDSDGGWSAALSSTGYTRLAHVWRLLSNDYARLPWRKLAPSRDGALMTAGNGDPDLDSGCQGALSSDATFAMVFFPSQLTVTVDMTAVDAGGAGSTIQANWFNTRTGETTSDGNYSATGTHNFTPPTSTTEYVLVLISNIAPFDTVALPHRASTATLNVPALRYAVVGTTLASSAALNVPTVAPGAVTVVGAHRASTAVLNVPEVALGGGTQAVTSATLASGAALNVPTLAHVVAGATRASTAQTFAPTAAYRVSAATLASTAALNVPTLRYVVAGATLASGVQSFAPTVVPDAVTVVGAHRASSATLNVPTVAAGGAVVGAHLTSGVVLNVPSITTGAVSVTGAHRASTASLTAPTASAVVAGATLASGAALNVPTLAMGPVSVAGAHRTSTASLTAPSVSAGGIAIAGAHRTSTVALNAPTVSVGAVTITGAHLSTGSAVFAPIIAGEGDVVATHLASTANLGAPTVSLLPLLAEERHTVHVQAIPHAEVRRIPRAYVPRRDS